ncbi:MAG: hypothetical protein J6N76_08695, partial [Lachnospiraceae bacterium]|nr:hypothetical protein [Lachnospiraceae bacterium]
MSGTEESRSLDRTRTLKDEIYAYRDDTQLQQNELREMEMHEEQGNEEVNFFTKEEALILQSIITEDKKLEKGNLTDEKFIEKQ